MNELPRDEKGRFLKGYRYYPQTELKKGIHPQTEIKKGQHLSPETEFKKGLIPWIKGRSHSSETIRKISEKLRGKSPWNKGKTCSENTKRKISEANRGRIPPNKGVKHTVDSRKRMSESKRRLYAEGKIVPWNRGKKFSKESCDRMSQSQKKLWADKRLAIVMKKRMMEGLHKKPTKKETQLNLLLEKNFPSLFEYVGGGSFLVGTRCPDWICNGYKVVELFGRYWHDPEVNPNVRKDRTASGTIEFYKKHGYDCLIVWEDELAELAKVVLKVSQFIGRGPIDG